MDDTAWDAARLSARLQQTVDETWARLAADGDLHPAARRPTLALPTGFRAMLLRALALESTERAPQWRDRHDALVATYLDVYPAARVTQLATASEPQATLFHTRLDWQQLPALSAGIARLFGLLRDAGVDPVGVFGAPDVAAFCAARPTLAELYAQTCFGGVMPMLYSTPADLAAVVAARDAGASLESAIDRRLAAPLIHELSHLQRERPTLAPPRLDECVSGYLGVLAHRPLAYPEPGADAALFGAPWFAQIGQALIHLFGRDQVVRAHAGVAPWSDVLGASLVADLATLGWRAYEAERGVHFLGRPDRPEPWLKALYIGAAGGALGDTTLDALDARPWSDIPATATPHDAETLRDALAAQCLHARLVDGGWRVSAGPARGTVVIDADTCSIASDPLSGEAPAPRYLLPPAIAARMRARGEPRLVLVDVAPGTLADAMQQVLTAAGPGAN